MRTITVEYKLGEETGVKSFTTQQEATAFCEELYTKKLKAQGFTLSKIYGPAAQSGNQYGRREVKAAVKKLPRFKALQETKLSIKVTTSPA